MRLHSISLLLFMPFLALAQDTKEAPLSPDSIELQLLDLEQEIEYNIRTQQEDVYTMAEVMPEFPGGMEAMFAFFAKNMVYPPMAEDHGIQGKVYVQFLVLRTGKVSQAKVLRGIGGGCDEETLRLINSMPRWKSGAQRGKPINVQYTIPVQFKLQ